MLSASRQGVAKQGEVRRRFDALSDDY
jgi:hypothetical protein